MLSSPALDLHFYGNKDKGFVNDFRGWFRKEHMVYSYFSARRRLIDSGANKTSDTSKKSETSEILGLSEIIGFLREVKLRSKDESNERIRFDQIIKTFENSLKKFFAADQDKPFYLDIDTDFGITKPVYLHESGKRHPLSALPHGYQALLGIYGALRVAIHKQGVLPETARGLVLIDEPELHLHVALQKVFFPCLVSMFPNIQFVIATHSPFVLNTVKNAVIFDLERQEVASCAKDVISGIQGWTLKEVLTNVLGLDDDMSEPLSERIKDFDKLTNQEDNIGASRVYSELEQMMHESNPLLKILRLKLSAIGGLVDD